MVGHYDEVSDDAVSRTLHPARTNGLHRVQCPIIRRFSDGTMLTLAQGGAIVDGLAIIFIQQAVHEFPPATLATFLHGSR